jgi:transposase
MTQDLLALADWLTQRNVTHVAMESTGVYWKPVFNLLETLFELWVVNAAHIKAVPGRKTDVKDAEWIAQLLRHGLLQRSFIPERSQRELRELTRYRVSLVRDRTAEVNRLQKTLEGANIKLSAVASDILGVSGRQILEALVSGQTDAQELAQLARGRLREKIPQLQQALVGQFEPHQRFMVAQQLAHIDAVDERIEAVEGEIQQRLHRDLEPPPTPGPWAGTQKERQPPPRRREPTAGVERGSGGEGSRMLTWEGAVLLLLTIPGVGRLTAETILAEIGLTMSRFPSAGHLSAWAGMAPGNNESGGKQKSGKTRTGSPWLRRVLVEAAKAAGRTQGTYLAAQYQRLKGRRGQKRAAVAVGHTILVMAYHMLKNGTPYEELGGNYFEQRDQEAVKRYALRKLEGLGYTVTLET